MKPSANEYLRLRFSGCQGKRGVLNVNGQAIESTVNNSGMLEFELPEQAGDTATLELYLSEEGAEPTHRIKTKLAYLDPVNTPTGIQARCNNLGFDCGVVDGVMGQKTREGVKQFQASVGLTEDGEPGPKTQQKLEESYGI